MTVADQWVKLLSAVKHSDPDFESFGAHGKSFMASFFSHLDRRSDTNRSTISKAIEAGIESVFLEEIRTCKDGSPAKVRICDDNEFKDCKYSTCSKISCDHYIYTKISDISFSPEKSRVIFEVKSALEFNSLAAAYAEAKIFKKNFPNSKFILFSIAGKNMGRTRAEGILKNVLNNNDIDAVFVLSETAGVVDALGNSLSNDAVKHEIIGEMSNELDRFGKWVVKNCV